SSRRRHTRFSRDWSSDVCSSDLETGATDVTVSINIADSEDHKKVAEYIQAQLEDNLPGFKLDIKAVPFAQRLEIEKAVEYDLSRSEERRVGKECRARWSPED